MPLVFLPFPGLATELCLAVSLCRRIVHRLTGDPLTVSRSGILLKVIRLLASVRPGTETTPTFLSTSPPGFRLVHADGTWDSGRTTVCPSPSRTLRDPSRFPRRDGVLTSLTVSQSDARDCSPSTRMFRRFSARRLTLWNARVKIPEPHCAQGSILLVYYPVVRNLASLSDFL